MNFLLDTNVVSEVRRRRPDRNVMRWFGDVDDSLLHLSVLVLGEIRQGIERRRRHDPTAAESLETWLSTMRQRFARRLLPVTVDIADRWGPLNVPDPLPAVDGLLAATALVHDMVLVTRNVDDVARTGVRVLNPFDP